MIEHNTRNQKDLMGLFDENLRELKVAQINKYYPSVAGFFLF